MVENVNIKTYPVRLKSLDPLQHYGTDIFIQAIEEAIKTYFHYSYFIQTTQKEPLDS